jgi:hypothetical protein
VTVNIFNIIIRYMPRINFPHRILCIFLIDPTRAALRVNPIPPDNISWTAYFTNNSQNAVYFCPQLLSPKSKYSTENQVLILGLLMAHLRYSDTTILFQITHNFRQHNYFYYENISLCKTAYVFIRHGHH